MNHTRRPRQGPPLPLTPPAAVPRVCRSYINQEGVCYMCLTEKSYPKRCACRAPAPLHWLTSPTPRPLPLSRDQWP